MIANAVTWLARRDAPVSEAVWPAGIVLRRLNGADVALYRETFRRIGTPWLWSAGARLSDDATRALIDDPAVDVFLLMQDDVGLGLLVLEQAHDAAVGIEVVYFGLDASAQGRGLGARLLQVAFNRAAERGVRRLWLHTCTFDDPRALGFYRRMGFHVTAQGYELMEDPRMTGLLPKDAAPHVPMVED